jgi:hypothetical protein
MNNTLWIAVMGTSAMAFTLKFAGHSVPEKWLSHPLIKRINLLIPIALLSALVAVQSVTTKGAIVIDHRLAGLGAAILALAFKRSFPIVVLSAAITSACVYNFL